MLKKLFAIVLSALVFNAYAEGPVLAQATPSGQGNQPIQVAQAGSDTGAGPATAAAAGGVSGLTIGILVGALLLGAAVTGGGDSGVQGASATATGN